MRKEDIWLGGVYLCKVTNRLVPVRVVGQLTPRGWHVENMLTKRVVPVLSARRLRTELTAEDLRKRWNINIDELDAVDANRSKS